MIVKLLINLVPLNFSSVPLEESIHKFVDVLILKPYVVLIWRLLETLYYQDLRKHSVEWIKKEEKLISGYSPLAFKPKYIDNSFQIGLVGGFGKQ